MRINKIELYNMGSYEGLNSFDILKQSPNGNVSIIGGKNGAGKTTLFSSIKLCLYGYRESGFQAPNGYYKRSIKRIVNNQAKISNNPEAYVKLDVSIFNGQDWDAYILERSWHLSEEKFETFTVSKNGVYIDHEATNDFDNYLLNLIPPELFDLYFFDGEQIADFFLEDKSGERIKKAFMTICGYDTFDILFRNFKRLSKKTDVYDESFDTYFKSKDALHMIQSELKNCQKCIEKVTYEIDAIENMLVSLEKEYSLSGGVSIEQWNDNFLTLKTEEHIREEKNAWLKNSANDLIPYIILKEEINDLVTQMDLEQDLERQSILLDALNTIVPKALAKVSKDVSGFSESMKNSVQNEMMKIIKRQMKKGESILNLSKEEYKLLLTQTSKLLEYDKNQIIDTRKEIKKSIRRSRVSRNNIERSSITNIDEYLNKKKQLLEDKNGYAIERDELLRKQKDINAEEEKAAIAFKNAEKNLEKHFKEESISSLTAKSIKFLTVLESRLFNAEIKKVEELFISKINQLMRKEHFVSKIVIDDDFTIHVYRNVEVRGRDVSKTINLIGASEYYKEYGEIHCNDLLNKTKASSLEQIAERFQNSERLYNVLIEFDKTTMSKGEKQVFIMALYWSMMELSNKEVPFIIDTPFARIDTVHRNNITKYFFKELKGQVFVFSTDEEITKEHIKILGKKLQSKFLIENVDNTKTIITSGKYFED